MFRAILDACANPKRDRKGFILDLRSTSEASAEKGNGGGFEEEKHYFDWKLVHAKMGKVKGFQASMMRQFDACQAEDDSSSSFLSKINSASWLHDVRILISTATVRPALSHRHFVTRGPC